MTGPEATHGGRTYFVPRALLLLFAATFPEILGVDVGPGRRGPPSRLRAAARALRLRGRPGRGSDRPGRIGWLAVLPFGGAYGIAEEGFGTKVHVDPRQQRVITGIPGAYGRWRWVPWVPATGIDLFHAAIGIGLEPLLPALLYPPLKGRSIASSRALVPISTGFAGTVTVMFFTTAPDPIRPLVPGWVIVGSAAVVRIVVGRYFPERWFAAAMRARTPSATPRAFFAVAIAWLLSFLVPFQIGSQLVPWAGALVLGFLLPGGAVFYFLITRAGWRENRRHQVAFAGGLAAAFLVWDVLLELLGDTGVLTFSVVLVGLCVWRWRNPEARPLTGVPPSGHRADRSSAAP